MCTGICYISGLLYLIQHLSNCRDEFCKVFEIRCIQLPVMSCVNIM